MNTGFCGGGCCPAALGVKELTGAEMSKGLPVRSGTKVSVAVRIIFVPPASPLEM